jgi:hypothetical protein
LVCFESSGLCWGFVGLVVGLVGLARASERLLHARMREELCVDFGFSTYPIPGLLVPQGVHH